MTVAFLDIDTQVDIMLPEGAIPVPGAADLIPHLTQLVRHASEKEIPLVSTVHAHPPDNPTCRNLPTHCVMGTRGQEKVDGTLWDDTYVIKQDATHLFLPDAVQWILEKGHSDMFTHPGIEALLDEVGAETWYVFGVTTDNAVKMAVEGLLARGAGVALVTDAMCPKEPESGHAALESMTAAGATTLTTAAVIESV